MLWQDPVPKVSYNLSDSDITSLKKMILDSGLTVSQMVTTAWASASTFRGSDKRGGANGGRLRLEPQRSWNVNNPKELAKVLNVLEGIEKDFNGEISMAQGRGDATPEQTDVESFGYLEPLADGFRNYIRPDIDIAAEDLLIDRANLLTLSVPEMTVLVGGLRVLGANYDGSNYGVFTDTVGNLTNDFFKNVLDLTYTWKATSEDDRYFEGTNRRTGKVTFKGTRADLIFGSNSELRAICEVYGANDGQDKFVKDFVAAWTKVMNLDRYDLK